MSCRRQSSSRLKVVYNETIKNYSWLSLIRTLRRKIIWSRYRDPNSRSLSYSNFQTWKVTIRVSEKISEIWRIENCHNEKKLMSFFFILIYFLFPSFKIRHAYNDIVENVFNFLVRLFKSRTRRGRWGLSSNQLQIS